MSMIHVSPLWRLCDSSHANTRPKRMISESVSTLIVIKNGASAPLKRPKMISPTPVTIIIGENSLLNMVEDNLAP